MTRYTRFYYSIIKQAPHGCAIRLGVIDVDLVVVLGGSSFKCPDVRISQRVRRTFLPQSDLVCDYGAFNADWEKKGTSNL